MKFLYMTISLSLSLSLFVVIRALSYELHIGRLKPPLRFYSRLLASSHVVYSPTLPKSTS